MNHKPQYIPVKQPVHDAQNFVLAAKDYSLVGMECFNECVISFERDKVQDREKVCMAGCIGINLTSFTNYAQYFAGKD
jgi:hypothetical protein